MIEGMKAKVKILYKKKTGDAISRRNFMFQLATEIKEAYTKGKTAQLAGVLLPRFNNSHQNSIVNGCRKRKQNQVNVNCEQNKITKFFCRYRRSVCGKGRGCVKVECVDCLERCNFLCFCIPVCGLCKQQFDEK